MPAVSAVAGGLEAYIFPEGACAGIVTTVFVPPGPKVSSSIAPMRPPGVVQTLIESQISAAINALPPFLTTACHLSIRKFICGSGFLSPQPQFFPEAFRGPLTGFGVNVTALYSTPFYLPSYPSIRVCQDYNNTCAGFITLVGKDVPQLVPNCSKVVDGVMQYPNKTQTIVSLPLTPSFIVPFTTTPNEMANSRDDGYKPVCPEGFVVPDDPSSERNNMIPGSGCAIACRKPIHTKEEYAKYDYTAVVAPSVSLPLVLAVILIWATDKNKRKTGYLVLCFATTSAVATVWLIVMAIAKDAQGVGFDHYFCLNNANARRLTDGVSMCGVQGIIMLFTSIACSSTWLMLAVDLFVRLVLNWKQYNHFYYHMAFILGVPLILVALAAGRGYVGYDGNNSWCMWADHTPLSTYDNNFNFPILGINCLGFLLMACVIAKISESAMTSNGKGTCLSRLLTKLSILKTSILFVLIFLTFWVSIFGLIFFERQNSAELKISLTNWIGCVFGNFESNDPSGFKEVCGSHAKLRIDPDYIAWSVLAVAGQSILVGGVFANSVLLALWKALPCQLFTTQL
jgi:hypothetical protein